MQRLLRLALVAVSLTLFAIPSSTTASSPKLVSLSGKDRSTADHASLLAALGPTRALNWLRKQPNVASALLGADGRTLQITFTDSAQLVILPRQSVLRGAIQPLVRIPGVDATVHPDATNAPGRALVLEPFNDPDQFGSNAGQAEADALTKAGFKVDIYRGADVTVPVVEQMGKYSFIFMESHSGQLPNGDAIVDTRDTDISKYPALRETRYGGDGSIMQALAAGETRLFIAFTSTLIRNHMDAFPSSSIVFINGCDLNAATALWGAFHDKGVDATISWEREVYLNAAVTSAQFLFTQLVAGKSVADSIDAATAAGYGTSLAANGGTAALKYHYDGSDTLAKALAGAPGASPATPTPSPTSTPSPTATAVPTATSVPLFVRVSLAHKTLKAGKTQTVTVETVPRATVKFLVTFTHPAKSGIKASTRRHTGIASAQGTVTWKIFIGHHLGTPATATLKVTASSPVNGAPVSAQKRFTIPKS